MQVESNILDPIHEGLPPSVFLDPESSHPKLKPAHRHWIESTVKGVLTDAGYTHVDQWLSLVLTGSLTTYQYGHESDCDVSLFVDTAHFPDWSRAEIIGLMISHVDGKRLPGTVFPMQCFVVPPEIRREDLYKPGLRSGYDLQTDQWIEPPDHTRVHDVEREYNDMYIYALEQADKMERLLRYEPDKAETLWHQIHERRRRDQKAGKGDYSSSNIVYKFLANRGLFPEIANLTGEYIAKTSANEPSVVWHPNQDPESLKGYVADHSFVHDTQDNVLHIGEQDRHHSHIYDNIGASWEDPRYTTGAAINNTLQFYGPWDPSAQAGVHSVFDRMHRRVSDEPLEAVGDNEGFTFGKTADADHQAILNQNAGVNLQNAPGPVNVPGAGKLQFHSHGDIQRMANEYNQQAGLGHQAHPTDYMKVRPEISAKIAQAYDVMPHNPQDPHVAAAYDALAKETKAQYDHIVKNGYNFQFYPKTHDPYPNSPREAVLDLHHNKNMYVYPTSAGYGSEDAAPMDHPLLGDSGVKWNGDPVTHNDLFRAVHDFYGHAKEGLGFRADGEDNAYRQHAAMFSPLARRALASETRGQNSWVNYGPHGESNQTAGQADTVFAPQKAGVMPSWVEDSNLHAHTQAKVAEIAPAPMTVKTYQYRGMGKHPVTQHGRSFPWVYAPHSDTLHLGAADTYHNDLIQNSEELSREMGPQKGNSYADNDSGHIFGRMSAPPNKVMMFNGECPPELRQRLADRCGATLEQEHDDFAFG